MAKKNKKTTEQNGEFSRLPYDALNVDEGWNVRQTYTNEQGVDPIPSLAEDIAANGLLTPLTVRPSKQAGKYDLVCGFRRYRALQLLREETTRATPNQHLRPADERLLSEAPCQVIQASEQDAAIINITENESREPVKVWELGLKCLDLKKRFNMSGKEIGERLKYHRNHINLAIAIAELPKPILDDLRAGAAKGGGLTKTLQEIAQSRAMNGEDGKKDPDKQLAAWHDYMGRGDTAGGSDDGGGDEAEVVKKPTPKQLAEQFAHAKEWRTVIRREGEGASDYSDDFLRGVQTALGWATAKRKTAPLKPVEYVEDEETD